MKTPTRFLVLVLTLALSTAAFADTPQIGSGARSEEPATSDSGQLGSGARTPQLGSGALTSTSTEESRGPAFGSGAGIVQTPAMGSGNTFSLSGMLLALRTYLAI